jgi:hypothetical protein
MNVSPSIPLELLNNILYRKTTKLDCRLKSVMLYFFVGFSMNLLANTQVSEAYRIGRSRRN